MDEWIIEAEAETRDRQYLAAMEQAIVHALNKEGIHLKLLKVKRKVELPEVLIKRNIINR